MAALYALETAIATDSIAMQMIADGARKTIGPPDYVEMLARASSLGDHLVNWLKLRAFSRT